MKQRRVTNRRTGGCTTRQRRGCMTKRRRCDEFTSVSVAVPRVSRCFSHGSRAAERIKSRLDSASRVVRSRLPHSSVLRRPYRSRVQGDGMTEKGDLATWCRTMQGSGGKIKRNRDKTRPKTSATYRLTSPWETAHKRLAETLALALRLTKRRRGKKEGRIERKRCEESEMNGLGT